MNNLELKINKSQDNLKLAIHTKNENFVHQPAVVDNK